MTQLYKFAIQVSEPRHAKVKRLEQALQKMPQVDCLVEHFFSDGLYTRRLTMPAGTVLTGAVHKTKHMVTVSGKAQIQTDAGLIEVDGFKAFIAYPGAKRAFVALTETVITNFHETSETDLDRLVEELTESTASELLGGSQNVQLLANKSQGLEA